MGNNGSKNFITHGISSDIIVVIVEHGDLLDSHGMTTFAVERGAEGLMLVVKKTN